MQRMPTSPRNKRRWTGRLAIAIALGLAPLGGALAQAVPVCEVLTLYGTAASTRLCKTLSTGNLSVCELTDAGTDVHSTVGAANVPADFHITVRVHPAPPNCEGNSYLMGTWNANARNLAIAAGQPAAVCNVAIQSWVNRFNAETPIPNGDTTACIAAFNAAAANGQIDHATKDNYIGLCKRNTCQ